MEICEKTLHFGKFIFKHKFLQANDTQAILGLDIPPPTWIQNIFLFRPLTQTCLPSTRCRICFPSQARPTSFPSPIPSNLYPQIPFLLLPETFPSQKSFLPKLPYLTFLSATQTSFPLVRFHPLDEILGVSLEFLTFVNNVCVSV